MNKVISFLPSVLIIVIAINQLILANFFDLSPWHGGGYGMFSTSDVGSNRHMHVYAKSEGILKELLYPEYLDDLALRTKSFPTNKNLKKFAYKIAEIEDDNSMNSIEVQVWKSYFRTYSLEPSGKMLKSLEIKIN